MKTYQEIFNEARLRDPAIDNYYGKNYRLGADLLKLPNERKTLPPVTIYVTGRKQCLVCKKYYSRPKNNSQQKWEDRKYCSHDCANKGIKSTRHETMLNLHYSSKK